MEHFIFVVVVGKCLPFFPFYILSTIRNVHNINGVTNKRVNTSLTTTILHIRFLLHLARTILIFISNQISVQHSIATVQVNKKLKMFSIFREQKLEYNVTS